jgi:hypothetical protein
MIDLMTFSSRSYLYSIVLMAGLMAFIGRSYCIQYPYIVLGFMFKHYVTKALCLVQCLNMNHSILYLHFVLMNNMS